MLGRAAKFGQSLAKDESGVTMLEYTILIGIITASVIALIAAAGVWVNGKWTTLNTSLT